MYILYGRIRLLHPCDYWPLQLFLPITIDPVVTVVIFQTVNAYSLNRQIRYIYTVTICSSVLEEEKGVYVYTVKYCGVALAAVLCDFAKQW